MEEKFIPLLDARNSDLWIELNEQYTIKLEEGKGSGYLTSFEDEKIRIEVDPDDLKPACLTHELLHIYLKYKKVCIAHDLKETADRSQEVRGLFSDSLKEHLGNCLEHAKMLPLYLNRGFKNKDFVRDYHDRIMEEGDLQRLRADYHKDNGISRDGFDKYVGKFISMKSSSNTHYDYGEIYSGMEKIDPVLFMVLEEFWKDWQKYEIGEPPEKYQESLDKFFQGLAEWKMERKIVE